MLIGVTGYAQAGKDTVADYLVEEYGFTKFAFADALRNLALTLNPWVVDHDWQSYVDESPEPRRLAWLVNELGWDGAKQNPEVRRFLQVLGTEGVRDHLGKDSWVNALDLVWMQSGAKNVVISDVRFPNEAEYVHRNNGILCRVARFNEDGTAFDNGIGTEHPSERFVASLSVDESLWATNVAGLHNIVRHLMAVYVNE